MRYTGQISQDLGQTVVTRGPYCNTQNEPLPSSSPSGDGIEKTVFMLPWSPTDKLSATVLKYLYSLNDLHQYLAHQFHMRIPV